MPAFRGEDYAFDAISNLLHGEMLADDAGAGDQHLFGQQPQVSGGQGCHLLSVGHALLAGAGIGAAAVDHDGLSLVALEITLAQQDRGCLDLVRGEDAGSDAGHLRAEDTQV